MNREYSKPGKKRKCMSHVDKVDVEILRQLKAMHMDNKKKEPDCELDEGVYA